MVACNCVRSLCGVDFCITTSQHFVREKNINQSPWRLGTTLPTSIVLARRRRTNIVGIAFPKVRVVFCVVLHVWEKEAWRDSYARKTLRARRVYHASDCGMRTYAKLENEKRVLYNFVGTKEIIGNTCVHILFLFAQETKRFMQTRKRRIAYREARPILLSLPEACTIHETEAQPSSLSL